MIIKYSDKFESLFYAILYSNLHGNFMLAKNFNKGQDSLFENEPVLDIDKINFVELLAKHSEKFGVISWFKEKNKKFNRFKAEVNLLLRYYHDYKYEVAAKVIKLAIKYGLDNIEQSDEKKVFNRYLSEIKNELENSSFANLRIFPMAIRKEKFMIVYYDTENQIADLIYNRLVNKYLGYKIILKDKNRAFFMQEDKIWFIDLLKTESAKDNSFEKFWETVYAKIRNTVDLSWITGIALMPV